MLKIESLSAGYGSRIVLKEISFDLPAGRILGVIGPNGAGKSTLIRALSGVLPLGSGRVWVDGEEVSRMNPIQRARRIAVVPQALQLPPAYTAWETVALGRTAHLNWLGQVSEVDEEIVRQSMERTRTLELAERRVGELSGGEQQRILLARALAQAAPVLLLDEPTAHLDLRYQVNLLEEIRRLAHRDGLTALLILHDLNLVARFADEVALLDEGRWALQGPPEFVLTSTWLSHIYQVPLEVIPSWGGGGSPVIVPRRIQ